MVDVGGHVVPGAAVAAVAREPGPCRKAGPASPSSSAPTTNHTSALPARRYADRTCEALLAVGIVMLSIGMR